MKFEQFPGSAPEDVSEEAKDTRLSEGEANDEANMLRAKMEVNPIRGTVQKEEDYLYREGGDVLKIESKPTAEDYDKAFEAIQELKDAAEKEPNITKVLYQIGRIINKSKLAAEVVMDAIGGATPGPESLGTKSRLTESMEEFSNTRVFEDAAARLAKIKEKGKKWGEEAKGNYRESSAENQEYKKAA